MSEYGYTPVDRSEIIQDGDEYSHDGNTWAVCAPIMTGLHCLNERCTHRRPIALNEAGAGSLNDEAKENAQLVEYYAAKFKEWEDELTQLRTIAKEQGEALREANQVIAEVEWVDSYDESSSRSHKCCWVCGNFKSTGRHLSDCRLNNAKTLIAKLKVQVGE